MGDTGLVLSIPVDSSFVSRSFDFAIEEGDLEVLQGSRLRHKVLEFTLHEYLQRRMNGKGYPNVEQEVRPVIQAVLHGNAGDLADQVSMAPNSDRILYRLNEAGLKLA